MKKSIIALAVTASTFAGVAQADTTLFGSIRMAYTYSDNGTADATSHAGNYGSRFGIKGDNDLGNGLTAVYRYENRINEERRYGGTVSNGSSLTGGLGTDDLYLGLAGNFGAVLVGTMPTLRDSDELGIGFGLSNNSDPSNLLEAGYGRNALLNASNAIAYVSPDMSGFRAGVAVIADATDTTNDHVDAYDLMARYSANGIYAGIGYQSTNMDVGNDWSNLGLGLGYEMDGVFNVGFLFEQEDTEGSSLNPRFFRLGGTYFISDTDSVYASVSMYDSDVSGADEVFAGLLGYQHNFSSRTRVWAEYGYQGETSNNANDDVNKFAVGLRTDF